MFNVNQITSELAKMADPVLQKYAAMHKNDPYTVALAVGESNRRKAIRTAAQGRAAGQQQPKVVDQDIAEMSGVDAMGNMTGALPENMGIGRLPAPNMMPIGKAEGGIIGYAERGLVANPYDPNAIFDQAVAGLLEREGGETTDQGGRTKYGISSKAHPKVDLDKLTKEEAKRIYKRDYWDANKLGDMAKKNPKLAAAALDTFVNHRYDFAKQAVNESGGDVNKLLEDRLGEYNRLAEASPKVHGKSLAGWNNRLMHLSSAVQGLPEARDSIDNTPVPVESAQATPQTQATPAKKEYVSAAAPVSLLGNTALVGTSLPLYEALGPSFKPGTTVKEALTRTGIASAVPAATAYGGLKASQMARNNLQLMSPEQRKELSDNAMLSAMSGDTGLAAAIMNAGQSKEPPPSMPYGQQMGNVGELVGNTLLGRKGMGVGALLGNGPKEEPKAVEPTTTDRLSPQVPDELKRIEAAQRGATEDVQVKPPEAAPTETESKTTSGGLASLFKDPAFLMGMRLMASQNPRFLGAAGEAGIGTVGDLAAAEKASSESAYRKSMGKYYDAYGAAIERGAKEKNETQQAEKSAQEALDTWAKNNKMALLQSPNLYDQMRNKYRMEAYTAYGIEMPTMAAGAPATAGGGFKLLGVRPG